MAWWFFALAVAAFASLNIDYVIVGRFAGVADLGLYSLAFYPLFVPWERWVKAGNSNPATTQSQ